MDASKLTPKELAALTVRDLRIKNEKIQKGKKEADRFLIEATLIKRNHYRPKNVGSRSY